MKRSNFLKSLAVAVVAPSVIKDAAMIEQPIKLWMSFEDREKLDLLHESFNRRYGVSEYVWYLPESDRHKMEEIVQAMHKIE